MHSNRNRKFVVGKIFWNVNTTVLLFNFKINVMLNVNPIWWKYILGEYSASVHDEEIKLVMYSVYEVVVQS